VVVLDADSGYWALGEGSASLVLGCPTSEDGRDSDQGSLHNALVFRAIGDIGVVILSFD
jgi:hypothetical protein